MKVKFDSLNRFEVPKMYVCNPGSMYKNGLLTKVVGCLSDTSDEELVLNFNATSELNFRVNRVRRDDPEENMYTHKLYRSIQNRRLIFVEDVGFFVITGVTDGFENGNYFKDVRAESCEIEIAQKILTYIEDGTYLFTELFEKVMATVPMWTIGHVDESVAVKYRTFEDINTDINVLAFLMDNIQDAYECICLFDVVNRRINIYDQNNYVHQTYIHITKDDVINSIEIVENSDDLYTAISVFGDNNLTISAVNPLGSNVIYNFDYYLGWMTPDLSEKVLEWQDLVESKTTEYYNLNLQYYELLTSRSNFQNEIDKITTQLTMYRRCRDNIVADGSTSNVDDYNKVIESNGGTAVDINLEIGEALQELDNLISIAQDEYSDMQLMLERANADLEALNGSITEICESLSMQNYFTNDEYSELYNYIYEGSYNDEYITISSVMTYSEQFQQMKTLFDRARSQLERVSKPTQEFSIDVENFLFVKEFESWSDQLETGCLINVELDDNDIAMLFLSNIMVNYYDRTLRLTFGNRFSKFDPKSVFDGVLGDIKKSANTLDYIKDTIYPIKNGEINTMKEALETSRTLTMNSAISSANEEVIIDGSGYTGRRLIEPGLYDPRQVKLTGKTLVFTDDAWDSCKVALGEFILSDGQTAYGLNAETILGQIIMGNNLTIVDSNGTPLLEVVDNKISSTVSNYENSLTQIQQTANDISIRIDALESNSEVTSVTTTTGYTFNAEGLTIHKSGDEITNLLDNTGMYVSRGEDYILTANNVGVEAINLTANQYLIVGVNSRFENYASSTDSKRTGCFFIGNTASITELNGGEI